MSKRPAAIDCWFNVNMGEYGTPDYLVEARRKLFGADKELYRDYTVEETVKLFDRTGIERAIITTEAASPSAHVLSFVEKRPDRFALGLHLDPRHGARAARRLKALVADHPAVLAPKARGIPQASPSRGVSGNANPQTNQTPAPAIQPHPVQQPD